jgi:hypothetical protein
MVLHSSLTAASAEAHRHDLLVDAERYRTAKAARAAVRRLVRSTTARPPDPPPREAEKQDEECRYAVSR